MEEPITGAGRYQRSTMVGAGGMGVVHRGFDRVLRREVAIKTLQGDLAKDDDSRQRMLREARAVAGLNHPNIVQLYDIFEDDTGTLSLVFEYVDGQSLSARIAKHGRLPLAAVLPICDDLVGALATAHGAGFVHRDIKPSNILLRRPGGRAVLLDFGIARPADDTAVAGSDALRATSSDITGPGMVLGTPGYMAPEQVDAQHRIGPGTDQFQLAVTLFEAIAGRLPWSDRSGGIVNIEKARSLRELDPALGEVDRVLAHALRPDVDDRYADIRLFADAFREAAAGGLAIAPGPMTPPPARHTAPTRVRGDATGPGDPAGPESEIRATRGPPVTPPRGAADAAEDGMAWSEAGPGERAVVEGKSAAARRKGLAFAAGALLALALLAIVAWSLGSEGDALVPSQPGEVPLVACPLFDVEGLGRDAAWLGAAAGQLACERVQLISGGTDGVAAGPPELLELPVLPDSDTDRRPYDAPGARERSREAALALRADAVLTGTVRVTRDRTFGVRLSLARRSGRVDFAEATGDELWQAIERAVGGFVAQGVLVRAAALDPNVARFAYAPDAEAHPRARSLAHAVYTGVDARERCEAGETDPSLKLATGQLASHCEQWLGRPSRALPEGDAPVLVGTSDLPTLTHSAVRLAFHADPETRAAVLRRLRSERLEARDRPARAALGYAEGAVAYVDGDIERARNVLVAAARTSPRVFHIWESLNRAARTDLGTTVPDAWATWLPGYPAPWCVLGRQASQRGELDDAVELFQRCLLLGPQVPVNALLYGDALVDADRTEEAGTAAALLLAGPDRQRFVGDYIQARADARAGRLERAHARLRDALRRQPALGGAFLLVGNGRPLRWYLELSELLCRRQAAATELAERFLLGETPRVETFSFHWRDQATALCLHAAPDRRGPCLDAIDALLEDPTTLHGDPALGNGSRAFVEGDLGGAARAWRSLANASSRVGILPLATLAGDEASAWLAERADATLAARTDFAGVHPATYRRAAARRAAGDDAEASALEARLQAAGARFMSPVDPLACAAGEPAP